MKKFIGIAVLIMIAAALFVGCGGSSDDPPAGTDGTGTEGDGTETETDPYADTTVYKKVTATEENRWVTTADRVGGAVPVTVVFKIADNTIADILYEPRTEDTSGEDARIKNWRDSYDAYKAAFIGKTATVVKAVVVGDITKSGSVVTIANVGTADVVSATTNTAKNWAASIVKACNEY